MQNLITITNNLPSLNSNSAICKKTQFLVNIITGLTCIRIITQEGLHMIYNICLIVFDNYTRSRVRILSKKTSSWFIHNVTLIFQIFSIFITIDRQPLMRISYNPIVSLSLEYISPFLISMFRYLNIIDIPFCQSHQCPIRQIITLSIIQSTSIHCWSITISHIHIPTITILYHCSINRDKGIYYCIYPFPTCNHII